MSLGLVLQSKKGTIIPITKTIHAPGFNPTEFFSKISDYGRNKGSILLESADVVPKYGENSIGSASPCLSVSGKKENFEIKSLNCTGNRFLEFISKDFGFCKNVQVSKEEISGKLSPCSKNISEEERLFEKTPADVLRAIAFKFKPSLKPLTPYAGLFGRISYDFVEQFEELPAPQNKGFEYLEGFKSFEDFDYELYFFDNLFSYDHKTKQLTFVSNALITNGDREKIYQDCINKISEYESFFSKEKPVSLKQAIKNKEISTDTSKQEFIKVVEKCKEHILCGDVFQIVPSRTVSQEFSAEPLDIYSELRSLNPSPYMFFMHGEEGILLGSSPEMCLRVQGEQEKTVEIRPIAGTKPRGIIEGKPDKDLDSRYEAELKVDRKELAEHTMLIDLARNDIARVSKSGSRHVDEPFVVEKYSHVQHLVSNVSGKLKPELDAMHAYLSSMNMGTLTGAPKLMAMQLLRKYEKTKRGFYGGCICYLTPSKDFDSAIAIRTMFLKDKTAFVRAGAGVVFDSIPEQEFLETENKMKACFEAIRRAEEKAGEAEKQAVKSEEKPENKAPKAGEKEVKA